jgi:hypothetical protein
MEDPLRRLIHEVRPSRTTNGITEDARDRGTWINRVLGERKALCSGKTVG